MKQKIYTIDLNLIINYLIILYAFFAPVSKAGTAFTGVLLILLWCIQKNFKSKIKALKTNNFIMVLTLFLLLSLISIFWSSDLTYYVDYMRKYWHLLMIPIIYTSLEKRYIKHVFSAFLLGMFISEIVSYGIFFEIWTKEGVPSHDPSPFMDHTNYSIYLAFTVFILMHRVYFEPMLKWKIIYGFFMLFSLSNMLVNGGRTGQVAFFITLIIVAFLNIKQKIRAVIGSIFIGTFLIIIAYNISPIFQERMNYTLHDIDVMVNKKDFTNSLSVRVSLWIMGTHQFLDNPIIGTGIGNEAVGLKTYIKKYNFYNYEDFQNKYIDYHNAYVQYAVQLGIGGLLLFILLLLVLFRLKFQSIIYKNLNITFVCLFAFLSMTGLSLHIMASMVLFSLFSGLFNTISKFEKTNSVEKDP